MRNEPLIKQLTAVFMAICLTIGSIGMLPAMAYADSEGADTFYGSYEEAEIEEGKDTGDTSPSASDTYDIDKKVAELLAGGEYLEGRAIVLYDTESPASDEELVGAGSLIAGAEQIAEVSAESYVNVTGETLEMYGEELVGASSESPDKRIAVLAVEDPSRSTEDILRELLSDPGVLSAEPDYIISLDDEGTGDIDEEHPKISAFISDEDITDSVNSENAEDTIAAASLVNHADWEESGEIVTDESVSAEPTSDVSQKAPDASVPDDISGTDEESFLQGTVIGNAGAESLVGASGDLTPYQWGMSDGSNHLSEDFLKNSDVYSVNSPKWNTAGSTNSEGVVVVMDSGIDYTHPDLKDSMYSIPDDLQKQLGCGKYGINLAARKRDVTDPMDDLGHGTFCAGIIAASWNGTGVSGVASGAKLMAVRISDEYDLSTYAQIVQAYEFVKKAKECGIDIRAANNSYSKNVSANILRIMVEELGRIGIICVYSSGNDNTYINPTGTYKNYLWDLPNVVIVNSSDASGEKTVGSNFSQNETHIFAPGEEILSTVPIQELSETERSYFTELDDNPLYTDPEWKNYTPDMLHPVMQDWMEGSYMDYIRASKVYDMSSCGRAPAIRLELLKDVPEMAYISACFLIPVDKNAPVSYVSADLYTPDRNISAGISVNTIDADLNRRNKASIVVHGSCDWVRRTVEGLSTTERSAERFKENYLPVYVEIWKTDYSALKAGDYIYIDNISVGASAYKNDQTGYDYHSGTSMAAPFATGMAMILYNGIAVNRENASRLAAGLKGMVRQKDSLKDFCTSGGVLRYSAEPNQVLPVINSASVNDTELTIELEGYFFGRMGDMCNVNLAGNDLDIVSWNEERVVLKCPSSMNSGMQKIILTDAYGRTTRGAFGLNDPSDPGIKDTAMPLYDSTLPEIPFDVIGADEFIVKSYGLLDTIYFIVSKEYSVTGNLQKLIGYSLRDKSWRVLATLPIRFLYPNTVSMTAYQGDLYLHGKDGEDKTHLICYMPAEGKWKEIAGQGIEGAAIANFHNRLISIGGYNPKYAGKVRRIDVSTDPAQTSEFMDLDTGFVLVQTAVAGNTLYLYGGFASDLQQLRFSKDNKKVFCYTVNGQESFRDRDKETEVYESTASDFSGYNSVICASDRDVYLVGAYMKEGISGSVTDPSGFRISEGDTWVLSNPMQNLGKRLSHTIVRDPCATVYKGVLYGLGTNTQDGDPLKYVARATVVAQNPDYPVQDIMKVKIPGAVQDLKYNGKVQAGVPESKDGSYTVKGNKKTDPGTYKAVVSLTDTGRFIWEDGTTEPKTITWSIGSVPVKGVKLDKTNLTLYVGSSAGLSATVSPQGAYNKAVTWKSADPKIAKVDADGKVTGVKAGTVKVTVTTKDGKKTADCTVKVITGVPVYRLYNIKGNGDHLFTTSAFEKNVLSVRGWKYEGVAWYEPKESSTPVYRSYNPNNGYHMYTCSKAERAAITKAAWKQEGIAFYSCREGNRAPVYRLYNPNSGEHFFTNTNAEKNMLIKAGWKYEGIGFYALNFTKN